MFYTLYLIYIRVGFVYTYSAWASGVARSTGKGNARAIVSGTSNEVQTLTLFSYLCEPKIQTKTVLQGRRKTLENKIKESWG